MRTGIGYDVHKLEKGRKLILGGVEIKYGLGLQGHSDADVLLHAICDALLGAAACGDIGQMFPDNDHEYKDISSLILLEKVREKISNNNYETNNIDATIICEAPKLSHNISKMIGNISETIKLPKNDISIKATTNEGIGFIGANKAIAAMAVATIIPISKKYFDSKND